MNDATEVSFERWERVHPKRLAIPISARLARWGLGTGFVVHGVAHAVLLARGASAIELTTFGRAFSGITSTVALVGFVAAGFGVLGAQPFSRAARQLAFASAIASVGAILVFGDRDLNPGLLIDALALVVAWPRRTRVEQSRATRHPRLKRIFDVFACAVVFYLAFAATARRWHQSWGTTAADRAIVLPGDDPDRDPAFEVNHAITIKAAPEFVWPWLAQIGQDRGGFYSYDWLENLFGCDIRNADTIHPEWQEREIGELVPAAQPTWAAGIFGTELGWHVTMFEPDQALVLEPWGAFVLIPQDDGTTRLHIRSTVSDRHIPVWAAALSFAAFEVPHFIMERRMLIGIRERAELVLPME